MGAVLEQLQTLLARRIDADGIVVWYDPEGDYTDATGKLEFGDMEFLRFSGSYFALKRDAEPLLAADEKPRLLVYVNVSRRTPSPLLELEAAGTVCEPGASTSRNTKLEVVARAALKAEGWPAAKAEEEVTNISSGFHDLSDVEALVDRGPVAGTAALSLVYGSSAGSDIALKFLTNDTADEDLVAKNGIPELTELAEATFGLHVKDDASPGEIRTALGRHVLLVEFRSMLGRDAEPDSVSALAMPEREAQVNACTDLARSWRLRTDFAESYAETARRVEGEYRLAEAATDADALRGVETFPFVENTLLDQAEKLLLDDRSPDALDLFERRRSSFWTRHVGRNALHWSLVGSAGRMLREAARVEEQAQKGKLGASDMVAAYGEGKGVSGGPWCELDRQHRGFERIYGEFEPAAGSVPEKLEQLVAKVRATYMETASGLAERFAEALVNEKFDLSACQQQTQTFRREIHPRLGEEKTAYLLVDALRYEMARELATILEEETEIGPAVAVAPTLTKLGMAALLPGAAEGMAVRQTGEKTVGAEIGGKTVQSRAERINLLRSAVDVPVCELKLDDVARCRKATREQIQKSDLVFITSQEIDDICERGEVALARSLMDEILRMIKRAIGNLAGCGVERVVVTADHGYLFGEAVDSSLKVDPPSGKTVELHRRAWIGLGAGEHPSWFSTPAEALGWSGELELAFPRSFAVFKSPGAPSAYVHGGMSLQELVVPVMSVQCHVPERGAAAEESRYELEMAAPKITTRMFTVRVAYSKKKLFAPAEMRVSLQAVKDGEIIGNAATAMYGFNEATHEVVLEENRENHVTLLLEGKDLEGKVSVRMLDADTEAELARIDDIKLSISI